MKNKKKISVIIVAAGQGKRVGKNIPKQFLKIGNKTILDYTLEVFNNFLLIDEIILVTRSPLLSQQNKIKQKFIKIKAVVEGGKTRQDSVFCGLMKMSMDIGIVLIHDGVRPFVSKNIIKEVIIGAQKYKACIPAISVKETLKESTSFQIIKKTLNRDNFWLAQTPQSFEKNLIINAYNQANKEKFIATDDANLLERLGKKIKIIKGDIFNIKITTKEDLIWAKNYLKTKNLF
ncbi:MAG: 2-C-methyl-D-erythritol 4-phosphate cytidylyltransferase [bacterium]